LRRKGGRGKFGKEERNFLLCILLGRGGGEKRGVVVYI